ncbi:MAG: hypothetical protein JWQ83_1593 [Lacunisphaera sp.]|nr:hypothetical protein [Lacunisphaera sp.]
MNQSLQIRLSTLCFLALSTCPLLRAQETPAAPAAVSPGPVPAAPEDKTLHKISGIFDTELPKTERKGSIRFIVHPHLGDFTSRSYVRVPLGIRWGVNDHVEFTATVEPYFEHGLKSGSPGNGIGDVEFGSKYALKRLLDTEWDASTGVNIRLPVGSPPVDMTDGYNHYTPYLVVSRKSERTNDMTWFISGAVDLMQKSHVVGQFRKNDAHSSSVLLSTGFVLDRYPYHYTLETGAQTTALIGKDNQLFVFVKPGFAWDLPRWLTFDSHGRWLFGVSVKITEGPDGTRIDSGGKIRGEFNLKRWFGRNKTKPAATP